MPPKIIFEDQDLLVIDKPSGLVVDNSETQNSGTLENWLKSRHSGAERSEAIESKNGSYRPSASRMTLPRMGIVHRLDKDTSGVILVAKTQAALENLQNQFKERIIKKEYLALVHGIIVEKGRVEGSIGRNPGNREKFIVLEGAREAVTEYEPIERLAFSVQRLVEIFPDFSKIQLQKLDTIRYLNYTLVRAKPHTGRTHQIRVHLKHIGYSIVSDDKYAGRKMNRLDKRWCPRMFLHAAKIAFSHPISRQRVEFESPLPDDLQAALNCLSVC